MRKRRDFQRITILAAVFVVAVFIFEIIFNASGEDTTSEMEPATLPVVYLSSQGTDINPLFGYTNEMDPLYTRDTITPLYENDLSLPITIRTYGQSVDKISYEIRTLDASRLIEGTTVSDFTQREENIFATLEIQNLLDPGAEYLMILTLETGGREVYYYSRVMIADDYYARECLKFALNFHDSTFDPAKGASLAQYMETDSSQPNDNLSYVTIRSRLRQVCWDGFEATKVGKMQISIKEIKKEYTVIILSYVLSATGEGGESEYYNVEEYYRVRQGEERMYLVDYERTMNQIFREDGNNFYEGTLCLGIRDSEVNFVSNETGNALCFVQEGELWGYNNEAKSLTKIFSFNGYEGIDERENNPQHEIRVIQVNETGGADFIVYGYMSRGIHEGEVGISVYHYDNVLNTIEELVWVPTDKSYQMMKEVVGRLMYVNDNDQFYILMDGVIWKTDLKTKESTVVAQGNGDNWFAVSEDNSIVSWVEGGDDSKATAIHVLNMETEEDYVINASSGSYIRPLGFIERDLIYGEALISQMDSGISGAEVFPMSKLYIMDDDKNIIKEYKKNGIYVSAIEVEDYCIFLDRLTYVGGTYVETDGDTIMNMAGDELNVVSVVLKKDERRQSLVNLQQPYEVKDTSPSLLGAKLVEYEDDRTIKMEDTGRENYYYAYAKGYVVKISQDVTETVKEAAKQTGVVVDGNGQYIWEQAKSTYKDTLPGMKANLDAVSGNYAERCISVIFKQEEVFLSPGDQLASGRTVKQILEDSLPNSTVLDLRGCELQQMLYYVNKENPVYAMASSTKPVLIVGYTSTKVTIYDPEFNETRTMPMEEAQEMFHNAGNIFLAYIMKEDH